MFTTSGSYFWILIHFYCPPINVTDNLIGNQDNPDTQAALDIRQTKQKPQHIKLKR